MPLMKGNLNNSFNHYAHTPTDVPHFSLVQSSFVEGKSVAIRLLSQFFPYLCNLRIKIAVG